MQITRFILLLFCSLAVNVSSAQDGGETDLGSGSYRNNFQIWPGVKLSHTFKKDWTVSAQYLLRADITNQNIDGHYISIGAKYRILKYLIADAGFRFVTSAQSNNAYRFEPVCDRVTNTKTLLSLTVSAIFFKQNFLACAHMNTDTNPFTTSEIKLKSTGILNRNGMYMFLPKHLLY